MKIIVGVIAFEEEEYIKALLDNWYPYAYKIIIAEGAWKTAQKTFVHSKSKDNTIKIIRNYPDPEQKIILTHLNEKNQVTQLNRCYQIALKHKPDWYVMSGADEFYHEDDLEILEDYLIGAAKKKCTALQIPMRLYWNDFRYYERQTARRFVNCSLAKNVGDLSRFRNTSGRKIAPSRAAFPILYHPSYVRSDLKRFRLKRLFRQVDGSSGAMKHYLENKIIYRGTCQKLDWIKRLHSQDYNSLPKVMREHPNSSRIWKPNKELIKI